MIRGRDLAKRGLVGLSKLLGFSVLKRMAGRKLYVVNYHSIAGADDDPYVNLNTYRTLAEFEDDLRFYKSRFKILNAVDLLDLHTRKKELPQDVMIITFDDGLRINFDHQLAILNKHGVTATFFLCSDFIDNRDLHYGRKANLLRQTVARRNDQAINNRLRDYLSDHRLFSKSIDNSLASISYRGKEHLEEIAMLVHVDFGDYLSRHQPYLNSLQVREMIHAGFTIGAHSVDHPHFGELTLEEQVAQTVNSLECIVEEFQLDYRLFAFPYSDDLLSARFYNEISTKVDLTFGMGGFVDDEIDFNIQRADIESTGLPVADALSYRLLLACLNKIRSHRTVQDHT